MSDTHALREIYHDLEEIDRRRVGNRFSGTLSDGTSVLALAIAPEVAARVGSVERFVAAFERAASIHHEALVPPIAWGAAPDGSLHCAYAWLGDPVAAGALIPASVASVGLQIARALSTTHGVGLVHGAITTDRIVVVSDRGPLLNEFGLFAALSEGGLGDRDTTALLSEPGYASPEAQVGKSPDARSDIYALGASLYDLLTGKPPYGGRTTSYVLASVLSEELEIRGRDEVANPVVEALMRAIERAPEDRWPDASAFARALAAGIGTEPSSSQSPQTRRGVGGFFRRLFRR